ncbi:hypothetical protein V500_10915 [Pseudogymnoascus sp. VKM F-4518 (FW-2643)]|nr:hypothetical protein V500_10915 [Pseudogymnoascus sp. VKM F-4518 (FW-2643)]
MGQCFQLAAPRAKRALRWQGKLGEILFDTSPHELVSLLAVPIEPAHRPVLHPSAYDTESQSDSDDDAASPSQSKAVNVVVDADGPKQQHAGSGAKKNPWDTFRTLPREIHELIFDHLDLQDITCVGIAAPNLWNTTQEIVLRYYYSVFGRWAGENIVCAGDDIVPGDYPPGLFSAEEEEDLNKAFLVRNCDLDGFYFDDYYDYGEAGEEGEEGTVPLTLHTLSNRPDTRIDTEISVENTSMAVFGGCLTRNEYWTRTMRGQSVYSAISSKYREIFVKRSSFFPAGQAWILRNLTTKEFVTSGSIALDAQFINGPFIKGIGFGEVVMSRTCWSSSDCISMSYDGQIHRGVWAGHRFDITTRGRHDESTKDEEAEWKDVSEEVVAEIAAIWGSEYGPGWREKYI